MKQLIEYRDRLSRAKRWKQLDEDVDYKPTQLDRDIVNPSQIRTVIRSFKDNLFTTLFPRRKEVPKTLILQRRTAMRMTSFRLSVRSLAKAMTSAAKSPIPLTTRNLC